MTTGEPDGREQTEAKQLSFDRFILDLHRGCLLLQGNEIALRPKTFAVLQHLIENSGRLVSKDELFAAVWPNLAVTDDALVQSIGELRRALGDAGPRLIRTIPRRGYRFESVVPASAPAKPSASGEAPDQVLVQPSLLSLLQTARAHGSKFFTPSLAGRREAKYVALALGILLTVGLLWAGFGPARRFFASSPSGDRLARSAEVGAKPAIAVLPFLNNTDDLARDYFVDGLTQDIINALGRFSALTVMSWNAVFPYKGKPASPGQVARSLAVLYQVEGSVRLAGDRVRVIVQLVNTEGRVLWSASFDEPLAEVFALQGKITTQVAGALAIRVTQLEQRRVFAKPTGSLEAYDYVLRARPALQRPTRVGNVEARAFLRRSIQLDPNYAAAYAALAETYHVAVSMGWAESPTTFLSRAEEMASKALVLDDSEVRAHIILGRVHISHQRYEQAKAEMDRALAVNPSDAHGLAGRGNILMWLGQTDAAIETLELAQRIDPELNAFDRFALSLAYYLKRRYGAAIEQAELNLKKTEGAHFSHAVLAAAYAQQARSEDAARIVGQIRRTDPTFDAQTFGSKFLNPGDLAHLSDGLRKAGLYGSDPSHAPLGK